MLQGVAIKFVTYSRNDLNDRFDIPIRTTNVPCCEEKTKARKHARKEKSKEETLCRLVRKTTRERVRREETERQSNGVISTWNDCRCSYFKRRVKKHLFFFFSVRCTKCVNSLRQNHCSIRTRFPAAFLPPLLHHFACTDSRRNNNENAREPRDN